MEELRKLAADYGDQELLRACLTVVQKYALLGARKALVDRAGDASIQCETCRERKAQVDQFEKLMKKTTASVRPIGADNSNQEG